MIGILEKEAASGARPLIHIESHGDPDEGLEFSNGSVLSWGELANLMVSINLATKFNLIVCLSACHAANFLGKMGDVDRPCPCRALIAPHKEMSPSEAMFAFREFYSNLLQARTFNSSIELIEGLKTEDGFWIAETAEGWFRFTSRQFVLNQCSIPEVKKRILGIHKKVKEAGLNPKIGEIKKEFMIHYREVMFQELFNTFFGLHSVPELRSEFEPLFYELKTWIAEKGKLGLCVH